jgi:hypothetical protein
MTVMFDRFFAIPQTAIRLGKLKNLSGAAIRLYVALCHESEYSSTREFSRTHKQLKQLAGGSFNTIAKARRELVEAALIVAEPMGSEGFVFVLCDPATGAPWPGHPKDRITYQPKGKTDAIVPAPSVFKRQKPTKMESAGTSFPYGWNDPACADEARKRVEVVKPPKWEECGS